MPIAPAKKPGRNTLFSSDGCLAATSARDLGLARSRSTSRTGSVIHGDHVKGVTRGTRSSSTCTPSRNCFSAGPIQPAGFIKKIGEKLIKSVRAVTEIVTFAVHYSYFPIPLSGGK